jgi:hypothetical protein
VNASPIPLRVAIDRAVDGDDDARLFDERVAVLRGVVDDALGPLAGRATATVPEVAAVLGVSANTLYEEVARAGTALPTVKVGRRVLVLVPGLCGVLLGVDARPDDIPVNETGPG